MPATTDIEDLYGRQSGPANVPSLDERQLSPEWTLADEETDQWVCEAFPKRYVVYEGDADYVTAWRPEELPKDLLEHAVNGHYESFEQVKNIFGDAWPQIVAQILSKKHLAERASAR